MGLAKLEEFFEDRIAVITLDNPGRRNALPRRLGLFSRILADSQDFVTHDVRG
ncbi:hypothetical protein HIJ39_22175, partial [Sulfobacillus sp. DSM 109850]|nr:hypothetical protein [Sulfobacillus harzensis]